MWTLAWRNLWRHRTRTIILLTAIGLPYATMIVSFGFIGDFLDKMEERAAESAGGTVLVHGDGYWNTQSNDVVVDEADRIQRTIAQTEGVEAAIPRVLVQGMLSSSRGTTGGRVVGIVPDQQARMRDLSEYVVRGDFLSEDHERPLVLGVGLVERLEVELGDKIVLTASDSDGEMTRALFYLRGVLETGSDQRDDVAAYTTLEAARGAVGLEGRLHQIGVLADEGLDSATLAERIRQSIGGSADGLEILTWQEAMPEMVSYLAIERGGMIVMLIVLFVVVAFVIANTFLMSVMERVREFGLFNALGLNHRRIGGLVFAETSMLLVLAIVAGFALGFGGHLAIAHYGIDFGQIMGDQMQVSGVAMADLVMRSEPVPTKWLAGTVGVVALVFASAAYPAWKAMKLAPTEAMEFYEQ